MLVKDKIKGSVFNVVSGRLIATLQVFFLIYLKFLQKNPTKDTVLLLAAKGRINEISGPAGAKKGSRTSPVLPMNFKDLVNTITYIEKQNDEVHPRSHQDTYDR